MNKPPVLIVCQCGGDAPVRFAAEELACIIEKMTTRLHPVLDTWSFRGRLKQTFQAGQQAQGQS